MASKKLKKLVSAALALAIVSQIGVTAFAAAEEETFEDIPEATCEFIIDEETSDEEVLNEDEAQNEDEILNEEEVIIPEETLSEEEDVFDEIPEIRPVIEETDYSDSVAAYAVDPAPADDKVSEFVKGFYTLILGRGADATGLAHWSDGLKSGSMTAAKVVEGFMNSKELQDKNLSNTAYVTLLYKSILGRNPDTTGLNSWVSKLDNGENRKVILAKFIESKEFTAKCENYGITRGSIVITAFDTDPLLADFVTNAYVTVLGRKPDEKGLNDWVAYLKSGKNVTDFVIKLTSSAEFVNKNLSTADFLKVAYKVLLGRTAGDADISYWSKFVDDHMVSRAYLINGIAKSSECTSSCQKFGISNAASSAIIEERDKNLALNDYVINVYESLLLRRPTAKELNAWLASIKTNVDCKNIITLLIDSTEFKNLKVSNDAYIKAVFKAFLGRDAKATEISHYVATVNKGGRAAMPDELCTTNEFLSYVKKMGLSQVYYEGWNKTANGRIYVSGGKVCTGWKNVGGKKYYFNPSNGVVNPPGWTYIGGFKYYFNADNSLCQDVRGLIGYQSSYYLTVDCRRNQIMVYAKDSNGNWVVPVVSFICSTGAGGATTAGSFTIKRSGRWHPLMGDCYGQYCSQINGNILFHSVWYYKNWDANTQSVKEYRKLGTSCSHGCVRLTVADAKWIYDNCIGSTVTVTYSTSCLAPFDRPVPPPITAIRGDYGHDPTDIWS